MSEKITVTYEIPSPPEGWEYSGVRCAEYGEYSFIGSSWLLWDEENCTVFKYPIAVRKQQWRPARKSDVGRTDARFRDYSHRDWIKGRLIYVFENCAFPFAVVPDHNPDVVGRYEHCEIPTEPTK